MAAKLQRPDDCNERERFKELIRGYFILPAEADDGTLDAVVQNCGAELLSQYEQIVEAVNERH